MCVCAAHECESLLYLVYFFPCMASSYQLLESVCVCGVFVIPLACIICFYIIHIIVITLIFIVYGSYIIILLFWFLLLFFLIFVVIVTIFVAAVWPDSAHAMPCHAMHVCRKSHIRVY